MLVTFAPDNTPKESAGLFSVITHGEEFAVVDDATGHPVAFRDTRRSAVGVAYRLNGLAMHGVPTGGQFGRVRRA